MSAAIEAQVERFAPGFRRADRRALARWTQRTSSGATPTYIGGDINGGRYDLHALACPGRLRHAASRRLPVLVVDAPGRRRARHVRLLGRSGGAQGNPGGTGWLISKEVASSRDLFANFERMRREIDELFGDVFERQTGLRGRGFSPSVDVFYVDDPPRAVVKADLAGVDISDVGLEIRGSQLLIAGERRPAQASGRLYQQIEIEHGPFRRLVELGAEVRGRPGPRLVRGRLPRGGDPARPAGPDGAPRAHRRAALVSVEGAPQVHLPEALPVMPLRDAVAFPDTLMPLAVEQERSLGLVNDVLAGDRMLVMVAHARGRRRDARAGRALRRRGRRRGRAHAQGARRLAAHPRPRRPAGRRSATTWPPSRT